MKDPLLEGLRSFAAANPGQEVCGLVVALKGRATIFPVKNVHPDPAHNFAMDHRDQNMIMERHLPFITGMFHSHNNGSNRPSKTDLAAWPMFPEAQGWDYYIIVDGREVWSWSYMDGDLHGTELKG